jgi:Asp-tRNA(Asn)/Glu-tRNA(Gln) amidotransferase A subunit family amidase
VQDSVGMPIGVQVAAPKWKDEQCLAIMKILEDSVKFLKRPNTETIKPY